MLEAHLRPGDRVAVENPGYAALFDLLRARGLALEPVAIDERGMRPDELAAALDARRERRDRHAARAEPDRRGARRARARRSCARCSRSAPQVLVIEDDHLGAGRRQRAAHDASRGRERWAATRSVAKALGPDLRLAVLAGDPQTVARVQGRQQCGPGWVSHILQRLVLGLWRDPDVRALHRARARATYAERRERLLRRARASAGVQPPRRLGPERVGARRGRGGRRRRAAAARLGRRARRALPPGRRARRRSASRPRRSPSARPRAWRADLADVLAPARAGRAG